MADHLLKSFLTEAERAGVTRLNPGAVWQPGLPSKPGQWWMICNECAGAPELVTGESRDSELWAVNCEGGTLPLKALHEGLTDCLWQEALASS